MKYSLFAIVGGISFLALMCFSCTTTPITIELEGPPLNIPDSFEIIQLVEVDLCENNVISFEREILPLIVSGCAYSGCHDAITKEEDVILETYEGIMKEVSAGNANNSELYKVLVKNPNDDEFMPPKPAISFTTAQINLVKDWINQGANSTTCNVPCNSEDISFSADIMPLIDTHCLGCHQPTNDLDDVNLADHAHVTSYVLTGQLLGSVKYINGYFPMPKTSLRMTDCQVAKFENWINTGALNN